jgi:hypothetical protein
MTVSTDNPAPTDNQQQVADSGVGLQTVTPSMAAAWLAKDNTHNRRIRPTLVAQYARDMADGNWMFNGETVKFAADGTLLDGQHRLAAVVKSGVTVPLLLVRGLPNNTQATVDLGARRTTGDVLNLAGERNYRTLGATLRRIWRWQRAVYRLTRGGANAQPSAAECLELLANKPEIRESVRVATRVAGEFRFIPASTLALAHWMFHRIDPDDCAWFFERLADGADLIPGHPVLTLRKRAMEDAARVQRVPEDLMLAFVIKAWNAFRDGRLLKIMKFYPSDPFPMPH